MKNDHCVNVMVSTRFVKSVDPFAIKGSIVRSGQIAEVSLIEAGDLLRRGRAVAATEAEVSAATTIVRSGTVDPSPDPQTWRDAVSSSFAAAQAES
jgi:hypothetical protein